MVALWALYLKTIKLESPCRQGLKAPDSLESCSLVVGGREVEDVEGTIGHCFLGLVGIMIFMSGGSLVIWALPTT